MNGSEEVEEECGEGSLLDQSYVKIPVIALYTIVFNVSLFGSLLQFLKHFHPIIPNKDFY